MLGRRVHVVWVGTPSGESGSGSTHPANLAAAGCPEVVIAVCGRAEQVASSLVSTLHRPHIAALVLNSVNHDARILKEADSLADAGYRVTLVGIQDNRANEVLEQRSEHVVIRRVDLPRVRKREQHLIRLMVAGAMAVGAALAIVIAILIGPPLDRVGMWLVDAVGVAGLVLILGIAAVGSRVAKRALVHARQARRLRPRPATSAAVPRAGRRLSAGRLVLMARQLGRPFLQSLRTRLISEAYQIELQALAPDAVHCHDLPMVPVGAAYTKNHSAKLVFDSHELYTHVANMPTTLRWHWDRTLRKWAGGVDGFITVNDSIAARFADDFPALPPAVVVRNATRYDGTPPSDPGLLREAAELGPESRILLYQGGFAPHRGLESLVRAAAGLPDPWVLVMMGWGSLEPELMSIASNVDPARSRVRFIPPAAQSELRQWTAGGDLGVIPYENVCLNHWFCSPNKLWEYPVAGLPMLVSPFPELEGIIDQWDIGVRLPEPLTATSLAALVEGIDDETLERMQVNCQHFLSEDNWDLYAKRLVELYDDLMPASGSK